MFEICRRQFGTAWTQLITASHNTTWRSLSTPIQSVHIPLFIPWQSNRMTKWLSEDTPKPLFPFFNQWQQHNRHKSDTYIWVLKWFMVTDVWKICQCSGHIFVQSKLKSCLPCKNSSAKQFKTCTEICKCDALCYWKIQVILYKFKQPFNMLKRSNGKNMANKRRWIENSTNYTYFFYTSMSRLHLAPNNCIPNRLRHVVLFNCWRFINFKLYISHILYFLNYMYFC